MMRTLCDISKYSNIQNINEISYNIDERPIIFTAIKILPFKLIRYLNDTACKPFIRYFFKSHFYSCSKIFCKNSAPKINDYVVNGTSRTIDTLAFSFKLPPLNKLGILRRKND